MQTYGLREVTLPRSRECLAGRKETEQNGVSARIQYGRTLRKQGCRPSIPGIVYQMRWYGRCHQTDAWYAAFRLRLRAQPLRRLQRHTASERVRNDSDLSRAPIAARELFNVLTQSLPRLNGAAYKGSVRWTREP